MSGISWEDRRLLERSPRRQIPLDSATQEMAVFISEGDRDSLDIGKQLMSMAGAVDTLRAIDPLFILDDMNIRGRDIRIALEIAGTPERLKEMLEERSQELVDGIRAHPEKIPNEPVVQYGASESGLRGGKRDQGPWF